MQDAESTQYTRRRYVKAGAVASGIALGALASAPAAAEPPGFAGRIYADDEVWATRGVADLPLPTDRTEQAYDELFPSPGTDLLPGAEAAPGNPAYDGGRWAVHPLTWHVEPEQLTDYGEVLDYAAAGKISFPADAVDAFECPLVRIDD